MSWSIKSSGEGFILSRDGVDLRVPATLAGIKVLNSILLDLNNEKIGQSGFPTQVQLDEMVRRWKEEHPKKEPLIKINLKALGIG